jgi:hypothetical protein
VLAGCGWIAAIHRVAEQALVGGMDPSRGVIRVGDTVRRSGMRVPVRALLRYLEAVGFSGAPRHLMWTQHVAETDFDARVEADAQWLADMCTAPAPGGEY